MSRKYRDGTTIERRERKRRHLKERRYLKRKRRHLKERSTFEDILRV
jgi:hypothetical protein